jgi:hypothetical protein
MSAVYPPEFTGDAGRQLAGQIKAHAPGGVPSAPACQRRRRAIA